MSLTAIGIVLDPDETMVERAAADNGRLRENFTSGSALNGDRAPHVTVLQRFVRTSDLDGVEVVVPVRTTTRTMVGIGLEDFAKAMLAQPFDRSSFRPVSGAIYLLGDMGTAQKLLCSSIGGGS